MVKMDAAEYAKTPEAMKEYSSAMAYQAANPNTSSSKPQAWDSGSAAYIPGTPAPTPGYNIKIGGTGVAYKDYKTANWNNMSQAQKDTWEKDGRNFSVLDDPDYLSKLNKPAVPLGAIPGGAEKVMQAPQTAISSATMPQAYSSNMGIGTMEQAQFGMPQQTSTATTPFKSAFDLSAAQKSASEQAAARLAQMQQGVQQGVDKYNTSRKNAFDYTNQTTNDNRVLAASMFNRNSNPFSGGTDYKQAQILRSNNLEDTAANNNYQADLSASNQKLTDFLQAAPEQQNAMYQQVLQQLQSTANQQDQVALQARGQDMSQSNADRAYNYGASQDQIKNSQWNQTFNQNQSNADRSYNAGRTDVAYNQGQDTITNNRNAANDALTLRKQHIDEANYYSDKYNIQVDPKDDFQLVLDQVAGKQTVTQQTAAQKLQDAQRSEAWKRVEQFGKVQSQADADLLGVPVGTESQKAKESAMDYAYKNRSANSTDYSNQTGRMNAETTAANVAFDNKMAGAKYELDQLKSDDEKDAAISKLLDSSPLLQKSYDSRGNAVGNKVAEEDKPKMAQYIANLGLSAEKAKKWFLRYELWSDSGK